MISLNVNQKTYQVDVSPDMPLLWVLRDFIGLTGTKYGCGVAHYAITHKGEPENGTAISRKSIAAFISTLIENPDLHKNDNLGISKP